MKPDMTDKDLDQLLSTLAEPDLPDGLAARIIDHLPARSSGWRTRLANLLGTDRLMLPAGGGLASLAIGLLAGYGLAPASVASVTGDDVEIALAAAFDGDPWLDMAAEMEE